MARVLAVFRAGDPAARPAPGTGFADELPDKLLFELKKETL